MEMGLCGYVLSVPQAWVCALELCASWQLGVGATSTGLCCDQTFPAHALTEVGRPFHLSMLADCVMMTSTVC